MTETPDLIASAIKQVTADPARYGLNWQMRMGTLVAPGQVVLDGDLSVVAVSYMVPSTNLTGSRVFVICTPGGINYLTGYVIDLAVYAPTLFTFEANWGDYATIVPDPNFTLSFFRKITENLVQIGGLVRNTASTTATGVVAYLPLGFRPPKQKGFSCSSSNGVGSGGTSRVDVQADGGINVNSHVGNGGSLDIFLDGIFFTLDY